MPRAFAPFFCLFALIASPGFALAAEEAPSAQKPQLDARRYIAVARRLFENLEYERALKQLQRAHELPGDTETDVLIPLCEGIVHHEIRQWEEAESAFKTALLLNPQAKLPWVVSKKTHEFFEKVRLEVVKQLPVMEKEMATQPKAPPPFAPSLETSPAAQAQAPQRPFPWIPAAVLGTGVVAAGSGLVLGYFSSQSVAAARAEPYQQLALAHAQRAHTEAKVANVLFGTAAALTVTAVVLYWMDR